MKILKIDHLGIAVTSIHKGKSFWNGVLGLDIEKIETVQAQKVSTAFFPLGESEVELFQGECLGVISVEPRGEGGFGYDPIFYLPELGKTMAELGMESKNKISHRGRASRELLQRWGVGKNAGM